MIEKVADLILRAGATLGAISIWLIAAIVNYDVVLRYFGRPTLWALEFSTYLMIGAATFGSGLAVVRGDHFSVDILPAALPMRVRQWLDLGVNLACLGLLLFVAYGFWQLIAISVAFDFKSATILRVPLVYPQSAAFAGFALMALAFACKPLFRKG